MVDSDLIEGLRRCLKNAKADLGLAWNMLRTWRTDSRSLRNAEINKHSLLVDCLMDCIAAELSMVTDALFFSGNLEKESSLSASNRDVLLQHYLLFDIVDEAARTLKVRVPLSESRRELLTSLRRSVHMHWRVVNVLERAEPHLGGSFAGQVGGIKSALNQYHRERRDIFVAHASADKQDVLDVLKSWRKKGERAGEHIEEMLAGFVKAPGDLKTLKADFEREAASLDLLSLSTWVDIDQMVPGDVPDAKIRRAVKTARIILIFFTQNYDGAWYLRTKENPLIKDQLDERLREEGACRQIPVVLSLESWSKRKADWWTIDQEPLSCPMNAHKLEGVGQEEIRQRAIEGLADSRLVAALTGDEPA